MSGCTGWRCRPRQLGDAQRFVAFMRAHVRSGRIRAAVQVAGERIVKLEVARGDRELLIWIRLWANAANCIVTDTGGDILDALYRRPRRGEISGGNFHPERDLAALQARRDRHGDAPVRAFGDPDAAYNLRVERHFAALEAAADTQRAAQLEAAARAANARGARDAWSSVCGASAKPRAATSGCSTWATCYSPTWRASSRGRAKSWWTTTTPAARPQSIWRPT